MVSTNQASSQRVAILMENQFEDFLFQIPYTALQKAGAMVTAIGSRMNEQYQGKRGKVSHKPDATATEMRASDFEAILIPVGGIRANPFAVSLVTEAMAQKKVVVAIGYGLEVLIEADQLQGKQVTGLRSMRKEIENAGATYIDSPAIVDDNLMTARRPSDLPILMNTLLKRLGLPIEGMNLPEESHRSFEWWVLGEAWGGSSRREIINALNTAIIGERYTLEAFKQYSYRAAHEELRLLLQEISTTKQQHVQLLEARLYDAFNEQVTWQAVGSEAYAALHSWLQSSDELSILRRALGDIQTGVIDTYHLCNQLTDPLTVEILEKIERDLARYEQRLAEIYRARCGEKIRPPMPTTIAAVS